ncbi:MAG TPA: cytochrome c [Fibrobacteria bacterium]|nr:cytochrome c [Fibrobacteria bacterium]
MQLWAACNKRDPNADPEVLAGRGLYLANCIACHNVNPALDGSLGPAIKGSSLELVKARVIHGEYPPGYTPKRATRIMVKLPLMEEDVEKIQAYLAAP